MGDLVAREGDEVDRILNRPVTGPIAVDIGERYDLLRLATGIAPACFETHLIGRRPR